MEKQGRENVDPPTALILGLLLPGAGHLYGGRFAKAAFFFVLITGTFLSGLLLSHFQAVSLRHQPYWFLGQVFAGLPAALAALASPGEREVFAGLDTGTLYTTVAGLLNILVMLDAAFPTEWRLLFNVAPQNGPEGPRDLLALIRSRPESTGILARFSSMPAALKTLKSLSFARAEGDDAALPDNLQCGIFRTPAGATVVLGGSLTEEQQHEVTALFRAKARELVLVTGGGEETRLKRSWWMF